MDLAAKGLGAKEWNNSLKTKLSLLPNNLFRIRMSRNFGMKMLTMSNLSTECLIQLSFPTRRSSDLLHVGIAHDHVAVALVAVGAKGAARGELCFDDEVDRKSTRLNSSHVKITYAVFCLIKTMTNLSTEYLIQLTKLRYDATPINQIL